MRYRVLSPVEAGAAPPARPLLTARVRTELLDGSAPLFRPRTRLLYGRGRLRYAHADREPRRPG